MRVPLPLLSPLRRRADKTDASPSSSVSIRIDADADGGDKADEADTEVEAETEAAAGDWWYEIGGSRAASEGNVAVPNGVDDAGEAVAGRKLRDDMSEADSEDRSEDEEEEDEPLAIFGFGIESAVRIEDDDADAGGRCGEAQRTGDSW